MNRNSCSRRVASTVLILSTVLIASDLRAEDAARASRHPNVVLVLTDDQGFGDVRSHGNEWIQTPIHDRIAAEGVRFDRFYVSPVCAPTRASLLTGRWHLRTGVHGVTRGRETMRKDEVTIAEVFKAAGYATAAFGKWHNGAHYPQHPNGQGFDEFVGFCAGHWNNYFDTSLEHNGETIRTDGFMIDVLTDRAIEFIKDHHDRPFFCYLPCNTPHSPWQAPEKYWQKYAGLGLKTQQEICAYAMVENIDDNMGRVLKTLDELGIDDDTIVVFLTDNGANSKRFNAGMKGRKGSLHEGGTRVPLFIRWPDHIEPGQTVKEITAHIDLLPTLASLTGVEIPGNGKPLDGISLTPLIRQEGENRRSRLWPDRTLFAHWGDTPEGLPNVARGAVRTQKWRAVKYNKWELYDMQSDPDQTTDLAKDHPEIAHRMSVQFDAWMKDVTSDGFEPIPTSVGHAAHPTVTLPGHEALLNPVEGKVPGISYVGRSGWANDWITNWTSLECWPSWPVQVVSEGKYRIEIDYACPPEDVGAEVEVRVGNASAKATIREAHDPPLIDSPDRIKRIEVYEKEWKRLTVGEVTLSKGEADLIVRANSRPGEQVMELKAVRLTKIED